MLEEQFDSCWNCGTWRGEAGRRVEKPDERQPEADPREEEFDATEKKSDRLMDRGALGCCSLMSGVGILVSVVYGFILLFHGQIIWGVITGVVGSVSNYGLVVVFREVNRIIAERSAEPPSRPEP